MPMHRLDSVPLEYGILTLMSLLEAALDRHLSHGVFLWHYKLYLLWFFSSHRLSCHSVLDG
jgi:hypothetical protein